MAQYVELDLLDDVGTLTNIGIEYLNDTIPGYESRPANIETVLLEAVGQIAGEVVAQVSEVAPVLFAYLGGSLLGYPIREATMSSGTAEILFAADVVPLTLPAGWQIALVTPDGDEFVYETVEDVASIPGGGTATVDIVAAEPGEATNGAFGAAEPIEVVDGVTSVTVDDPTSGGTDIETEDAYLNRLADALTLLAPRPILPEDHATMARQVAGVARAVALDLTIPASTTPGLVGDTDAPEMTGSTQTNVPRATTVGILGTGGVAPSNAVLTEVYELLDTNRELNFLNYVLPPTFSIIDVQVDVAAYPGFADADVIAAVEESLTDWLDPLTWGAPPNGLDEEWVQQAVIRIYEVIDHANRAQGVDYVVPASVEVRIAAGSWQATDLTLPGLIPLPQAGTFTVTVL